MKLGVYTVLLAPMTLEDTLKYLTKRGIHTVEIGCGGYSGVAHADPDILLYDDNAFEAFKNLLEKYKVDISALNCSGNPVHPNKEIAQSYHKAYEKGVLLAEKLGVDTVITFSGCPGGSPNAEYPNWVTCFWPPEIWHRILDYQWQEVLIPYWKEAIKFASSRNIKVALEPIAGFCVYNPETFWHLRNAVDSEFLGVNLDLSHLFWQQAEPQAVIRELNEAIFHFHAKDTRMDHYNTAKNGVLDYKHFKEAKNRAWNHYTVGYGHDALVWKDIIRNLRLVGYDGTISIEHEDPLASRDEGLHHAIDFLSRILLTEEPPDLWWIED
ncbi:MAG: sugar phosphate isomerase/epimerase [Chloroflexota bacterium]|nr:sugar phosphate isomerase/epimerase [Chloroflexota bacterium]